MTLNLIKSLEAENSLRGKMVYLPHTNKSIAKAQNNGWVVNNTTAAHIANGIEKLNNQYLDGSLIKKVTIKSNSKLDGIPTIGFPNIFIQSTFMRLYYNNFDRMNKLPACRILMDYFKEHKCCMNCSRCSGLCYNNKFEAQYPQKAISELRILLAYITDRPALSAKIIRTAKRSKSGYFRINQNGEIHSEEMLCMWTYIALKCPEIEFYTYTKSYELFEEHLKNNDLPANFHVNMSVIEGQEERLSKYSRLYAGNKFKMVTEIPEGSHNVCTGNCSTCGRLCMQDLPKDDNTILCLYHN